LTDVSLSKGMASAEALEQSAEARGVQAEGGAYADGVDHDHTLTNTGLTNTKLAMWIFLGSECLLFGGLISTFLLYKHNNLAGGPTPHDLYDIELTSISSFVLLMSSLTMVLAVSAIQRGEHARLRLWLATTAILGSIFISGQVYEFQVFVKEGLGFTTNAAGSAFFALTGFHGVHVTLGIVMLLSALVLSLRGRIPQARAEAIEIVGLYWHFVDVVWVLIFTIVYLIP
jgi:heme/copper-type cytochrome/quinol oxidase subunit 3